MATHKGKSRYTKREVTGRRRRGDILARKRTPRAASTRAPVVTGQGRSTSVTFTERDRVLLEAISDIRDELMIEYRRVKRPQRISPDRTRYHLALAVVTLVSITTISSLALPSGLEVLDKLLPSFAFVLGYFFQPRQEGVNGVGGNERGGR